MNLFAWHVPKPKKEVTTRKNNSHIFFVCVMAVAQEVAQVIYQSEG